MMGITSEMGGIYKWIGGVVAGVGVISLFIPGVNLVTSAIVIGAGAGTVAGGTSVAGLFKPKIASMIVKGDGIDNEFMAPTIIEAKSETFEVLNCKDIVSFV
jgi:hypothetical protein